MHPRKKKTLNQKTTIEKQLIFLKIATIEDKENQGLMPKILRK